jgi:O-antigen/teichoic acid export membrane protein
LTTIEDLVNPVLINWEKTILANQLSTRVLTFYMVPFNILSKLQMIPSSISSAAFPVFSGYHGSKNLREAHTLAVRSTRYTLILLLPIIVFMLVFGKALLVVWMGEEFAIRSIVPMYILAIATVATSLTFAPFSLLRGFGRPEVTMFVRLLEVPIYIPFTFLLVNMYGLVGASVSYLAYRILDAFLLWTVAVSRLQLPLQSFREAVPWYAIVTACVTGTVLWWISRQLCFDGSIPIIGIGLFLLVASTWWISWNCDIDDGERQLLIRSLVLL